jgi:rhodanese-related sulfurtransferase
MKTIQRDELKQWMDENRSFILVETLPLESFTEKHLPGAHNIPENDEHFEDKVEDLNPDKSKPVVVYCANSECQSSPRAARRLESVGFRNVYDYEAGKEDWQKAGYRLSGKEAA